MKLFFIACLVVFAVGCSAIKISTRNIAATDSKSATVSGKTGTPVITPAPTADTPAAPQTIPDRIQVLFDDGYENYMQGNFKQAIVDFETAELLSTKTLPFEKKYFLFHSYLSSGNYSGAITLGKEMISKRPDFSEGQVRLGVAYLLSGKTKDAMTQFKDVIGDDPDNATAHMYLGLAHSAKGNATEKEKSFTEAYKKFKIVLEKNDDDLRTLYELSYLLALWGGEDRLKEAKKYIATAYETVSDDDSDYSDQKDLWQNFNLPIVEGIIFYKEKNYEQSLTKLLSAIDIQPDAKADIAEIYFYIGQNYMAQGKTKQATQFLYKAKEIGLKTYEPELNSLLAESNRAKSKGKKGKKRG